MQIEKTCPVCEHTFFACRVKQLCCQSTCVVRERHRRQRGEPVSDREWYPFKSISKRKPRMQIEKMCPVCEGTFLAHRVRQLCCRSICIVRERNRRQRGEPITDREWYPFKAAQKRTDGCRTCPQCHRDKPDTDEHFSPVKGTARRCSWCRACQNQKSIKQKRIERQELLRHYGGDPPSCACCGETTYEFLCVDHMDGGGNKHRAELRSTSGSNFYGWLRRNKYPPGFRVLCHNCNLARGFYGQCPHERST